MNAKTYIEKIWQKDPSAWPGHAETIRQRLGWLDCISEFEDRCEAIQSFARGIPYSHVVLLGMGGSSLVSQVFASCLSHPKRSFFVLDTTDPLTILSVQKKIPLEDTLFIVASKSGTTIEVDCLMDYFYSLRPHPEQFVAITDFNTPLMRHAEKLKFRHLFVNPSDIGGRFAALSYFGLVPLALMGGDAKNFLACAKDMVRECQASKKNPAWTLATFLFENALSGKNKLTFLSTPSIRSFPLWIEQLIAESTGKSGKGILPVLENPQEFSAWTARDRMFVSYHTSDERLDWKLNLGDTPNIKRTIKTSNDLAGEFFLWEFATALLGSLMEINPFDEPNVVESKKNTMQYLSNPEKIHAEIQALCKPLSVAESMLDSMKPPEFIGLLTYLPKQRTSEVQTITKNLSKRFTTVSKIIGEGPGYLHSTGQFHKGGPNQGRFWVLVDDQKDLQIPNRNYGFQTLKLAQALGDYRALEKAGRNVVMAKI